MSAFEGTASVTRAATTCGLAPEAPAPVASEPPNVDARMAEALLAKLDIEDVLRLQVEGALSTSDELAGSVIEHAQATFQSTSKLARFMAASQGEADSLLASMAAAIESADNLERVTLQERSRSLSATSGGSRQILAEQQRLVCLGQEARRLGMTIRIVALNTNIQAARLSNGSGGAISVLAGEITTLAAEVQKLGENLMESIQSVSRHLSETVIAGVAKEIEEIQNVKGKLSEQVAAFRGSYERLENFRTSVWTRVQEASHDVSSHASNTLGSVQNQDVLRQRLEQVVQVFAMMARNDAALRDALLEQAPLPEDWSPILPEDLSNQYVMNTQRQAHARGLGRAQKHSGAHPTERSAVANGRSASNSQSGIEDEGPKIELF